MEKQGTNQASRRRRTARPKTPAQLAGEYPLSIVIPARNAGATLPACLDRLAQNDLQEVEILVVDDQSEDDTAEVVARHQEKMALRLVPLSKPAGPGGARNAGMKAATSPYLLFLDSDVLLPERAVYWIRESLHLYSHRPEVAGVLGGYSESTPWPDFLSNYKNLTVCYLYRTTETLSPFIHSAVFCIRKAVLQEVGGFDTRFATAEDFRLGIVLGSAGYRFAIDRRIQGVHLKRYRLGEVLREDLRRIRDLGRVALNPEEREFSIRAHRWGRILSVALPGPILVLGLISLWLPAFAKSLVLLLLIFLAVNLGFFRLCWRVRGLRFALAGFLFLFTEMLWAELAVAYAQIFQRRGQPVNPGNPARS